MSDPGAEALDRRSRVRGGIVLGLLATALVAFAQDARAKTGPPKSEQLSAVSQYRESIPASEGPALPGAASSTSAPLPAPVTREIQEQGGSDARTLVKIATKSELGAPSTPLPRIGTRPLPRIELPQVGFDKRSPGLQAGPSTKRPDRRQVLPRALASSTGGIVAGSGGGHLLGLVILLALIAIGGAVSRRRTTSR